MFGLQCEIQFILNLNTMFDMRRVCVALALRMLQIL
jgi:hypothetical protein